MKTKICANCRKPRAALPGQPKTYYATWTCRGCGAKCCRHLCGYKVETAEKEPKLIASCGNCARGFMRPGAVEA